jgi:hypothetical protein
MTDHYRRDCTHVCAECDITDACPEFEQAGDGVQPAPRRLRTYIAGPLNAPACDYLQNVHRFVAADRFLRRAGLAPFNPSLDLITGICDGEFAYDHYFNANFAWVEVAEAVYLIDESPGANREVERALELGIPVFESLSELVEWARR